MYHQRSRAATQEGEFGAWYIPSKADRGCPVNSCLYCPQDQTVAPAREVDLALECGTWLTKPTAAGLPSIYDSSCLQGTVSIYEVDILLSLQFEPLIFSIFAFTGGKSICLIVAKPNDLSLVPRAFEWGERTISPAQGHIKQNKTKPKRGFP